MPEMICKTCNKVFYRRPAKVGPYCSKKCSGQDHRKDFTEAFWNKVDKTPDCWLWTGGKAKFGHGLYTMGSYGHTIGAHRFSYELTYGPIPEGLFVCHHCDNPACVRPDHLFLGNHMDNSKDCVSKNRQARGEIAGNARLTEANIHAIRSAPGGWGKIKLLGAQYGVSPETITRIRQKKLWKHI